MKSKDMIQRKVIQFEHNCCRQKYIGWPKGTKFVKDVSTGGDDVGTVDYWTILPKQKYQSRYWIGERQNYSYPAELVEIRFSDIFEIPELDENLVSAAEMVGQYNIAGMTFIQRTNMGDSIAVTGVLKIISIEHFNKCYASFIRFPDPGDNWHKDDIIMSHERTNMFSFPYSHHNSGWRMVPRDMAEEVWSNFTRYAWEKINGWNPVCPYALNVEYEMPQSWSSIGNMMDSLRTELSSPTLLEDITSRIREFDDQFGISK